MKKLVVYIHGKGGSAAEAEHYKKLFPAYDVIGFDYQAQTPWDAVSEFTAFFHTSAPAVRYGRTAGKQHRGIFLDERVIREVY